MSKVHHFGRVHFSRVAAIAVAIALTAVMVAAQSPRNELQRKAETELLALHRDERRAHFQHDIPALLSHLGPHIVDVRDGTVQVLTPDDIGKHFAEYSAMQLSPPGTTSSLRRCKSLPTGCRHGW